MRLTLFLFISLITLGSSAIDLSIAEDSLIKFQIGISDGKNDEERQKASDGFRNLLMEVLEEPGVFEYPFQKMDMLCTLTSPDAAFRLFNWNLPMDDLSHKYYCFILFPDRELIGDTWIELTSESREPNKLDSRTLDQDEWIGMLYYEIIPVKKGKGTSYTLLAWDGHNRSTTRKFIDILSFQGGKARFGSSMFKTDKGVKKRMVFEYSSEVSMSLRYHPKKKMIIFDHLAPRQAGLEGVYTFYGPDLTFDAFVLDKASWKLESNIEVRNDKDSVRRPYNDPPN